MVYITTVNDYKNKVSQFTLIKIKISNLIENVSNNRAHELVWITFDYAFESCGGTKFF